MPILRSFDPILFLGLKVDDSEIEDLRYQLLEQISQYVLIRTIELLPSEKVPHLTTAESIFNYAFKEIPSYDKKVQQFLADFKREWRDG